MTRGICLLVIRLIGYPFLMLKIAYYEFKRFIRDRRTLVVFLALPIVIIMLLGSVTVHEPENIKIAVANVNANTYSNRIVNDLKDQSKFEIEEVSPETARTDIEQNKFKTSVIINITKNNNKITGNIELIENSTVPEISANAKALVGKSIQESIGQFTTQNIQDSINSSLRSLPVQTDIKITGTDSVTVNTSKNTDKNIKYTDFFASAVIVLLILIVGLNTSSTTITQERIDGTFERFFVTPYSKFQMIAGKMLAFTVISIILALVTIFSLKILFDVTLGPLWLVLLISFLNALAAISLGVLISSFTYTIAESIQVSILCFFASLILTGLIFQPETMHPIAQKLSAIVPFTYSVKAMREVNILNFNFNEIKYDLLILIAYAFGFQALAILALKRKAN